MAEVEQYLTQIPSMSGVLQPTSISLESRHREISFEEFREWDGENRHVEWVDGKVEELSPVSKLHQQVGGFLISLLRLYSRTRQKGEVLYEPFVMRVAAELPARSPDICSY